MVRGQDCPCIFSSKENVHFANGLDLDLAFRSMGWAQMNIWPTTKRASPGMLMNTPSKDRSQEAISAS